LLLRSQTLYPTELRARDFILNALQSDCSENWGTTGNILDSKLNPSPTFPATSLRLENPIGVVERSGPLQERHWLELMMQANSECRFTIIVHGQAQRGAASKFGCRTAGDPSATWMVDA